MRFWDAPPSTDVAETEARITASRAVDPLIHAAFAVVDRACGDVVGMVNYRVRQSAHGRLAIGWIVVPSWRRNGIAREAAGVLIRRCFTVLASNRIEARIAPDNRASLQLAERVGFHREGLMREWAMVDGTPRDMLLFALLRSDWSG